MKNNNIKVLISPEVMEQLLETMSEEEVQAYIADIEKEVQGMDLEALAEGEINDDPLTPEQEEQLAQMFQGLLSNIEGVEPEPYYPYTAKTLH